MRQKSDIPKSKVTLSLPDELLIESRKQAIDERVFLSDIVTRLLEKYLKEIQHKKQEKSK